MKTQALVCTEEQDFSLAEVELSEPVGDRILVRTLHSGVSIGTEFALIRGKISWGPYPLCTGYQATGVVEALGPDVGRFKAGDVVYYRGSSTGAMTCSGQAVSLVSGTHAAHAIMGENDNVEPLPDGADAALSSTFVMPAVGLHGTDLANPRLGDVVVVYGVGQIGLGVVAACSMRGCCVIAIDIDTDRLAVATQLGADLVVDASTQDVDAAVKDIAPGGADVVFESSGLPELLRPAMLLCRDYGKFVWQGNYGQAAFPYEFYPAHGRHLTMFHPCNDGEGPCRRAVIKNMAAGVLKWDCTITHRVAPDESPALFDGINQGNADKVLGAIINWS